MTNPTNTADLRAAAQAAAAQAVVDRWDTPTWKDVPATAEYINRLRAALAAPKQPAAPIDAAMQQDAERLDFLIEQRAYVVSDPSICDGYWLHYARPNGETWVQSNEHTTPRAAIDAARAERIK